MSHFPSKMKQTRESDGIILWWSPGTGNIFWCGSIWPFTFQWGVIMKIFMMGIILSSSVFIRVIVSSFWTTCCRKQKQRTLRGTLSSHPSCFCSFLSWSLRSECKIWTPAADKSSYLEPTHEISIMHRKLQEEVCFWFRTEYCIHVIWLVEYQPEGMQSCAAELLQMQATLSNHRRAQVEHPAAKQQEKRFNQPIKRHETQKQLIMS